MTKIFFEKDEWYFLQPSLPSYKLEEDMAVEVPDKLWEEYSTALENWQTLLSKINKYSSEYKRRKNANDN